MILKNPAQAQSFLLQKLMMKSIKYGVWFVIITNMILRTNAMNIEIEDDNNIAVVIIQNQVAPLIQPVRTVCEKIGVAFMGYFAIALTYLHIFDVWYIYVPTLGENKEISAINSVAKNVMLAYFFSLVFKTLPFKLTPKEWNLKYSLMDAAFAEFIILILEFIVYMMNGAIHPTWAREILQNGIFGILGIIAFFFFTVHIKKPIHMCLRKYVPLGQIANAKQKVWKIGYILWTLTGLHVLDCYFLYVPGENGENTISTFFAQLVLVISSLSLLFKFLLITVEMYFNEIEAFTFSFNLNLLTSAFSELIIFVTEIYAYTQNGAIHCHWAQKLLLLAIWPTIGILYLVNFFVLLSPD